MKKYLVVTVDTNDADYNTKQTEIDDVIIEKLKPLFAAIKDFKKYKAKTGSGMDWTHCNNYPYGECARDDLGEKSGMEYYSPIVGQEICDLFESNFAPHCEYGFHTVESVKFIVVESEEVLI